MSTATIVRNHGEGELRRFFGGGLLTMKLTAEESGGSLMLFEDELSEGKMTPLHIHADEDELLFVLAGEILVHIDGVDHAVGHHGLAFAPRGVPHAFLVTSPSARVLTLQTPGTAEAFYREASEPAAPGDDPMGAVDFARVHAAAARVGGMKVLGPPPFSQPAAPVLS
jgi:quercetin dioxygenase-like cupin family protein